MTRMVSSFWRAAAYCLHPRVIWLSFLPVLLLMAISAAGAYFFWQSAISVLEQLLESTVLIQTVRAWLDAVGLHAALNMVPSLLLIVGLTPLLVLATLLAVSTLMTPALVRLAAQRRFPDLVQRCGASFAASVMWALASSGVALLALAVTSPMWIVPPLVLVLPPLIWGWLTARVMAFDALAAHADASERRALLSENHVPLLVMGVVVGMLGVTPSLLWTLGLMAIAMAPLLVPLSVWVYTLIFVFSSLWFAHFCLDALQERRARPAATVGVSPELIDIQL
jgi:hypothetical protein